MGNPNRSEHDANKYLSQYLTPKEPSTLFKDLGMALGGQESLCKPLAVRCNAKVAVYPVKSLKTKGEAL